MDREKTSSLFKRIFRNDRAAIWTRLCLIQCPVYFHIGRYIGCEKNLNVSALHLLGSLQRHWCGPSNVFSWQCFYKHILAVVQSTVIFSDSSLPILFMLGVTKIASRFPSAWLKRQASSWLLSLNSLFLVLCFITFVIVTFFSALF